jgi:hypothetical protein
MVVREEIALMRRHQTSYATTTYGRIMVMKKPMVSNRGFRKRR